MSIPFNRTVCDCNVCVGNCQTQPGNLVPSDVERIVNHVGVDAKEILVASPGAVVMQHGRVFRIGTITPASNKGRCIFLSEDNRCTIHSVAPFGCAYFDCKMSLREAQLRSGWGLRQIMGSEEYQLLRDRLPLTTSYKPKPY